MLFQRKATSTRGILPWALCLKNYHREASLRKKKQIDYIIHSSLLGAQSFGRLNLKPKLFHTIYIQRNVIHGWKFTNHYHVFFFREWRKSWFTPLPRFVSGMHCLLGSKVFRWYWNDDVYERYLCKCENTRVECRLIIHVRVSVLLPSSKVTLSFGSVLFSGVIESISWNI